MKALFMQWLGLAEPVYQNDAVGKFMTGWSIPRIAAEYGGGDMIATQRGLEDEIRAYILELEQEISDLRVKIRA